MSAVFSFKGAVMCPFPLFCIISFLSEPSPSLWETFFVHSYLSMKHRKFELEAWVPRPRSPTADFSVRWPPEPSAFEKELDAGTWKSFLWDISFFLETKSQARWLQVRRPTVGVLRPGWSPVLSITSTFSFQFSAELSVWVSSLSEVLGQICVSQIPFHRQSKTNCCWRTRGFRKSVCSVLVNSKLSTACQASCWPFSVYCAVPPRLLVWPRFCRRGRFDVTSNPWLLFSVGAWGAVGICALPEFKHLNIVGSDWRWRKGVPGGKWVRC